MNQLTIESTSLLNSPCHSWNQFCVLYIESPPFLSFNQYSIFKLMKHSKYPTCNNLLSKSILLKSSCRFPIYHISLWLSTYYVCVKCISMYQVKYVLSCINVIQFAVIGLCIFPQKTMNQRNHYACSFVLFLLLPFNHCSTVVICNLPTFVVYVYKYVNVYL